MSKRNELCISSLFEFEKVLKGKSNKLFYAKADVDKVIAEKDAEINNLKKQLQDKENDIENVKESMNIKIDKNEVETLVKVLEDYKEVLLNRMAKEANNGRFSNVNGKRNFIYKFIIPLKLKLLESLNKENG